MAETNNRSIPVTSANIGNQANTGLTNDDGSLPPQMKNKKGNEDQQLMGPANTSFNSGGNSGMGPSNNSGMQSGSQSNGMPSAQGDNNQGAVTQGKIGVNQANNGGLDAYRGNIWHQDRYVSDQIDNERSKYKDYLDANEREKNKLSAWDIMDTTSAAAGLIPDMRAQAASGIGTAVSKAGRQLFNPSPEVKPYEISQEGKDAMNRSSVFQNAAAGGAEESSAIGNQAGFGTSKIGGVSGNSASMDLDSVHTTEKPGGVKSFLNELQGVANDPTMRSMAYGKAMAGWAGQQKSNNAAPTPVASRGQVGAAQAMQRSRANSMAESNASSSSTNINRKTKKALSDPGSIEFGDRSRNSGSMLSENNFDHRLNNLDKSFSYDDPNDGIKKYRTQRERKSSFSEGDGRGEFDGRLNRSSSGSNGSSSGSSGRSSNGHSEPNESTLKKWAQERKEAKQDSREYEMSPEEQAYRERQNQEFRKEMDGNRYSQDSQEHQDVMRRTDGRSDRDDSLNLSFSDTAESPAQNNTRGAPRFERKQTSSRDFKRNPEYNRGYGNPEAGDQRYIRNVHAPSHYVESGEQSPVSVREQPRNLGLSSRQVDQQYLPQGPDREERNNQSGYDDVRMEQKPGWNNSTHLKSHQRRKAEGGSVFEEISNRYANGGIVHDDSNLPFGKKENRHYSSPSFARDMGESMSQYQGGRTFHDDDNGDIDLPFKNYWKVS